MVDRRILIVEDDPDIVEVLRFNLGREGFDVLAAQDGVEGVNLASKSNWDLILLDLMMPRMDGLEVCERLRADERTRTTPIIMLTAKGEEADIVQGLQKGADDYVTKPFSPKEIIARINAVLRRSRKLMADDKPKHIVVDDLVVDVERFEAKLGDESLPLTRSEFLLLHALACNKGRVLTRDQLINEIRGNNVHIVDRNIDVHVNSLRKN